MGALNEQHGDPILNGITSAAIGASNTSPGESQVAVARGAYNRVENLIDPLRILHMPSVANRQRGRNADGE
jgi:hypothetical protein